MCRWIHPLILLRIIGCQNGIHSLQDSQIINLSCTMLYTIIHQSAEHLMNAKGRYGNIHKWMETVETTEERQALAKNSLHTLAVLKNTYARMSGSEAKSVMRKLANKKMLIAVSRLNFQIDIKTGAVIGFHMLQDNIIPDWLLIVATVFFSSD